MGHEAATGVSSVDVIALINSSAVLVAILAVGFSLVGAVAVWRAGQRGALAFFRMFERLQVLQLLQLLTVMLVIASATVLALFNLIESNGIIGILSGVAGYVLGGLNRAAPSAKPASSAAEPAKSAEAQAKDRGAAS